MEAMKSNPAAASSVLGNGLSIVASVLMSASVASISPAHADDKAPQWITARYAVAVSAFRRGSFPEAYGRFIAIAELGYAPAARQALWICENGEALLGTPFDCDPEDIEDWATLAGTSPRETLQRIHPGYWAGHATASARR